MTPKRRIDRPPFLGATAVWQAYDGISCLYICKDRPERLFPGTAWGLIIPMLDGDKLDLCMEVKSYLTFAQICADNEIQHILVISRSPHDYKHRMAILDLKEFVMLQIDRGTRT